MINKPQEEIDREMEEDICELFFTSLSLISSDKNEVADILESYPHLALASDKIQSDGIRRRNSQISETPAIILAVRTMPKDIVEHMLDLGADPNARDKNGHTPLHYAGRADIIDLLIAKGADIGAKDARGCTPFFLALAEGDLATAELLHHRSATIPEGSQLLHDLLFYNRNISYSIGDCSLGIPYTIDKTGADIHWRNKHGETALLVAVPTVNPKLITTLITLGANINDQDSEGRTALMRAVGTFRQMDNLTTLLSRPGININAQDKNGWTALHHAAFYGIQIIQGSVIAHTFVEQLTLHGANVLLRNKDGKTALEVARGHSLKTGIFNMKLEDALVTAEREQAERLAAIEKKKREELTEKAVKLMENGLDKPIRLHKKINSGPK